MSAPKRPSGPLLFLTMYPLRVLDRAPKVRSYRLWQELNSVTPTALVQGGKWARALGLLTLALTGKLFRVRAAYVESSSASASPIDLLLLAALRLLRKPLYIYVRDAYPLFPEDFPARTFKRKVSYWGWRISFQLYRRLATTLLFPTAGLAQACGADERQRDLLPPGGDPLVEGAVTAGSLRVGYVGELNRPVLDLLRDAMASVRRRCTPEPTCIIVAARRDWDAMPHLQSEPWCEYRQASREGLAAALEDADVCLVPRPARGYYVLTLPIKLFDYMSLGKAIVTTDLPDVAAIVTAERIGIVAGDDPDSFADAILHLLTHPDETARFQRNSIEAARGRHSWRARAQRLLEIMSAEPADRPSEASTVPPPAR